LEAALEKTKDDSVAAQSQRRIHSVVLRLQASVEAARIPFVDEAALTKEFHDHASLVAEGWEEES
jgi:hypothetical protein